MALSAPIVLHVFRLTTAPRHPGHFDVQIVGGGERGKHRKTAWRLPWPRGVDPGPSVTDGGTRSLRRGAKQSTHVCSRHFECSGESNRWLEAEKCCIGVLRGNKRLSFPHLFTEMGAFRCSGH